VLERRPPLLLLCHPQNPTGRIVAPDDLRTLQELADRAGTVVVSDEVHAPLSYGAFVPHAVATSAAERTVTLASMSKAFNLAGTRCGVAIVGSEVEDRWVAVPRRLRSGASLPGIVATLAALEPEGQDWLRALVEELRARRDQLVAGLVELLPEATVIIPEAGYLLWADLTGTVLHDDPAARLLAAGLRVSPGPEFGPDFTAHVRINFATSSEGVDRILECVARAVTDTRR
jgi:cystathionine beta-lyase